MPQLIQKIIKDEKGLEQIAFQVLNIISENKIAHATVLALQGDLGAGKTTFTKILAKTLGITESVTSPTFVIQKTFDIKPDETFLKNNSFFTDNPISFPINFKKLIHIDSYRLDLSSELSHLGWHDILNHSENLIVVEWPERIADILPEKYLLLKFEHVDETTRQVEIENKFNVS